MLSVNNRSNFSLFPQIYNHRETLFVVYSVQEFVFLLCLSSISSESHKSLFAAFAADGIWAWTGTPADST